MAGDCEFFRDVKPCMNEFWEALQLGHSLPRTRCLRGNALGHQDGLRPVPSCGPAEATRGRIPIVCELGPTFRNGSGHSQPVDRRPQGRKPRPPRPIPTAPSTSPRRGRLACLSAAAKGGVWGPQSKQRTHANTMRLANSIRPRAKPDIQQTSLLPKASKAILTPGWRPGRSLLSLASGDLRRLHRQRGSRSGRQGIRRSGRLAIRGSPLLLPRCVQFQRFQSAFPSSNSVARNTSRRATRLPRMRPIRKATLIQIRE
jgi:hypothetical protein